MDRQELIRRGDANLVAYLRHLATTSTGGEVLERDGLLLFAGAHNYPGAYTNGAIRLGTEHSDATADIGAASRFFDARRRGFALWVRGDADADLDRAAAAAGLWPRPPVEGNPGIAIDHPLPDPVLPAGTTLRRVCDDAGARAYLDVVAAGYGVAEAPLEVTETILFSLASLQSPQVAAFLASAGDEAVAGCMTYVAAGAGGLQWAATRPALRGGGLGTAVFVAACNAGFEMGATCATGQSSALGTPIWVRLGFEVVTRYRRYLARPGSRSTGPENP